MAWVTLGCGADSRVAACTVEGSRSLRRGKSDGPSCGIVMIMKQSQQIIRGRWLRQHRWALLATPWSAAYLAAAIAWTFGAPDYPYGRHWDSSPAPVSLLDGVSASTGLTIMIISTLLALGATLRLMLSDRQGRTA